MKEIELVIKISEEVKQAFDCAESNDLKGCYYDHGGVIGEAIKNGTPLPKGHGRKFEEIVVEYPPAELCTYPEYRGKPYFSIKYEENGEHIIGFGTYKPEVLSSYLREYFIVPTIIEADKSESEE